VLVAGDRAGVRVAPSSQDAGTFPAGASFAPSPDGVVAADLDYDFLTDLVLAGPGGLRLLRQADKGRFEDFTGRAGIAAPLAAASLAGAWVADIDTDGDLDVIVAPGTGRSPRSARSRARDPPVASPGRISTARACPTRPCCRPTERCACS
jgi:hypothetical protein